MDSFTKIVRQITSVVTAIGVVFLLGIVGIVVANIIVLGFLAATSDIVSDEALKKAILDSVPPGTGDFNMKAFNMGYNYGIDHGKKENKRIA